MAKCDGEMRWECGCATHSQTVIGKEHFKIVGQTGHQHEPEHRGITANTVRVMSWEGTLAKVHITAQVRVCAAEQAVIGSAVAGRKHGGVNLLQSGQESGLG